MTFRLFLSILQRTRQWNSLAKEFVTLESGRLHMTTKSDELFSLLRANEIMQDEIDFLSANGKKLTDRKVKELTGGLL